MEEKQQISVLTFPLQIWTEVLVALFNSTTGHAPKAKKEYREILSSFFALKTASRQLNQQFDDQFFYLSIFGRNLHNLRLVYMRARIQNIIKYGKYTDLEALLQLKLEQHWRAYSIVNALLNDSLPLVAQHADPSFMNSYLGANHHGFDGFSLDSIVTALRRANERKDNNEMSILLLPKLFKFCGGVDETQEKMLNELIEALKSGTKLNFENVVGFEARFKEAPTVGLLSALIGSEPVCKRLIVPDGTMLHADSLGSKNDYNKGLSNLYLNKGSETSDIIYRFPLDGSHHRISVQKNVKDQSPIYIYEDFETENEWELVLKTSLYEKIFGMMYLQQFVMVTYEALKLPLEDQPWFLGIISDAEKNALLHRSSNAFFTYGYRGKVYFASKEFQNKKGNSINSVDQIEAKIPKNKLMLGIYNNGKPKDLELHFAFKYIRQGNLELTKKYILENNIDVKTAFNDTEIIRMYLEATTRMTVNNELIIWLIEKGVPIERTNFHSSKTLIYALLHRCNEKALRAIIQHSQCYPDTLRLLCDQGASYELLKLAYSKTDVQIDGFISTFLTAVKLNKMPQQYNNRTLIMLAWQCGNSENYFKMLPIEIMHHILSFEDIDEPAYFPFLEYLFSLKKKPKIETNIYTWFSGELIPFLPFFWKHWGQLFTPVTATYIARAISKENLINDEIYGPKLRSWFKRIVTSEKFTHEFSIDVDGLSALTLYCLKTPTEEAASMLKFLLDRKLITREGLLAIRQLHPHAELFGPATWYAVLSGSIPTIKYLLDENMLPEYNARGRPKSLSDLFTQIPDLQKVQEFRQQYRANK